jgi:uncharacterized metal-binding protein YceD (DUF177 family)
MSSRAVEAAWRYGNVKRLDVEGVPLLLAGDPAKRRGLEPWTRAEVPVRIALDTITDDGVSVPLALSEPWVAEAACLALDGEVEEIHGELVIERSAQVIKVQGNVLVAATRSCERCGETVPLRLELAPVDLSYAPEEDGVGSGEVRLAAGDLDVGYYAGGAIELASVLCEAIALELPTRLLCEDTAACDERFAAWASASGDPAAHPFSALRNLF